MRILDRLPYNTEASRIMVAGNQVRVRPNQIVVWVSVGTARVPEWDPKTPAFPAILDPGNNFTFSIYASQLIRWAGIRPEFFRNLGMIREGGRRFARHEADLWLHRNIPGTSERRIDHDPFRLSLDVGIAVYPDEPAEPAHLPLLGLRALTENKLETLIDSRHCVVSMHTSSWFSSLLRFLRLPPY